jgi:phage pi2 protein 07
VAEHKVSITSVPEFEILHKDLEIEVRADDGVLGRLTISKGGIGWYPRGPSKERHFNWEQFDRLVQREFGER